MPDDLKPLLYFVKEREAIRKRKEALERRAVIGGVGRGQVQLTKDPILVQFRFCNLRRRDDRVSRWLREHVLTEANIRESLPDFLMFAAFCRWINWPPTIQTLIDEGAVVWPTNWKRIGQTVDRISKNEKAYTGAYMIRAPKKKGAKKGAFIAQTVINKHYKDILPSIVAQLRDGASYREIWETICLAENFGSFMAGQIAGDLTYTSLLSGARDLKTWAPMGPGSIRGFNRIMQNPGKLSKKPTEALWQAKIIKWRAAIIKRMGPEYEDLTALDVQNVLCEVDKYLRFKLGQGRPRARYTPHTY